LENFDDDEMKKQFIEFAESNEYRSRKAEIDDFNSKNRWTKRGLGIMPMKYGQAYFGNMHALVSIYHADGTVAITHGGIEMGQGLNTKVAQVAAHLLGIPMSMIKFKVKGNKRFGKAL
jgi:xanthine dehydrogenase/oxidase